MGIKKSDSEMAYEKLFKETKPVKVLKEPKTKAKKDGFSGVIGACHMRAYLKHDERCRFMSKGFSRKSCGSDCAMIISNDTGKVCAIRHSDRCHHATNMFHFGNC